MLVVEVLDVQKKLFDSPELLPLYQCKSSYRFLHLHGQFKSNNNKMFYQK